MNYRTIAGEKISALGYGCMRFPTTSKNAGDIDREKAAELLKYAAENGVNYFDTAYVYHEEKSENFIGEVLKPYRDKINFATKSPTWKIAHEEDFDRFLNEQLERLGTDRIDFYLMHALDRDRFDNIVMKFGIIDKLNKAKADGKIRHIGFSFHDDLETFKRIVDANPAWEFCQIQLNYINTDYQAGLEGLEYAHDKGLDVVIMEPLLGGKLANLSEQVSKTLSEEKSQVEWALDFLWNRSEVSLILSGMGAMEQVKSNIEYASRAEIGMLTDDNLEMLKKTKEVYDKMALVPCTKCAYCMPCPFGLDIPAVFEAYNTTASDMGKARQLYSRLAKSADMCKKCKKCEKVCPQGIAVSSIMTKIADVFK